MKTCLLAVACGLLVISQLILPTSAGPYLEESDYEGVADYNDNAMDRLYENPPEKRARPSLIYLFRRSCVRRGGNCDHRPKDCCYNSSCRCNLWGANCRCQRMGLFQKWG